MSKLSAGVPRSCKVTEGTAFRCPACGCPKTLVLDTRDKDGAKVRTRACHDCRSRFRTVETVERVGKTDTPVWNNINPEVW